MKTNSVTLHPDRITSYFRMEWKTLLAVTISGLIYNIGLLAGPWFEGRMAQCLLDIFGKKKDFYDMLYLTVLYTAVIAAVQFSRYLKRLYVRRFANHVNRCMKEILYGDMIHRTKKELEQENVGAMMTKAISDVDACVEGMRKFTTEIFDTGIALLGYIVLLLYYDWKLALLCLIFPPISYILAEKMKTIVQRSTAASLESRGRLNAATLDRVSSASTYRVFGCEEQRNQAYEKHLSDYEKNAVNANILVSAMPPLYQIISMISVLFILSFGARNVSGNGWSVWNVAAFTTFLSCFTKLSVKSAKAAKLFNAVHKAEVSWKRIKPLMKPAPKAVSVKEIPSAPLFVQDLGVFTSDKTPIFQGLSFDAKPGEIIGITGAVACGKSTLGRTFLGETPYQGSLYFKDTELASLSETARSSVVGYLGHDPELMSGTIRENILLGDDRDITPILEAVCLKEEVSDMPDGADTLIGNGGIRLSGGQKARLSLARTLLHPRPILILDDPFSALDRVTEERIFEQLKLLAKDSIVLLISHRLYLFPEMNRIIWMENGKTTVDTHEGLMKNCPSYAALYNLQKGEHPHETIA